MYKYKWDEETGGYELTMDVTGISKEVRPVFFEELDLFGFNDLGWEYPHCEQPLLWAEMRRYFYRGRLVAEVNGGGLYTKPTIKLIEENLILHPVDISKMIEKNKKIMTGLVQNSIEIIYDTYEKYKGKMDVIYVAFSGGKDSVVLLDLVQRALPHSEFKVVFGDTTMEISDTKKVVAEAEKMYPTLEFHTAKSHMDATESWKIFGPPSKKIRWCCSVHKFTPQMTLIRDIAGKANFNSLAYVGVRQLESKARSNSGEIEKSKKFNGQYNSYPIRLWSSAEIYLYILGNNVILNNAYRKGNSRVGCLFCPMSNGMHDYVKNKNYEIECKRFIDLISEILIKNNKKDLIKSFLNDGEWGNRRLGQQLFEFSNYYVSEYLENDKIVFETEKVTDDWLIWVKTIGKCYFENNKYFLKFNGRIYEVLVQKNDNKTNFYIYIKNEDENYKRLNILFRNVLRKSAYCVKCGYCELICKNGSIRLNDKLSIDDCINCGKCHDVDRGCLVCGALRLSVGGGEKVGNIDRYKTFGFRKSWLEKYLAAGDSFWETPKYGESEINNKKALGTEMQRSFKKFLLDSEIMDSKGFTIFASYIKSIGVNSVNVWAFILVNLSYTPQIGWYVKNIETNQEYSVEKLKDLLDEEMSKLTKRNVVDAYKNIFTDTPLGQPLNLGICNYNKRSLISITRTGWDNPEPLVILYSLYKFAEKCDGYYNFTLSYLCDDTIERDGISPTLIFGISSEILKEKIINLATDYPEFISATFNKDLDNIDLNKNKTSLEVLELLN